MKARDPTSRTHQRWWKQTDHEAEDAECELRGRADDLALLAGVLEPLGLERLDPLPAPQHIPCALCIRMLHELHEPCHKRADTTHDILPYPWLVKGSLRIGVP